MKNTIETGTVQSADGTPIAYRRHGEGPVLVLVDAAGAYHAFNSMDSLAEILADAVFEPPLSSSDEDDEAFIADLGHAIATFLLD